MRLAILDDFQDVALKSADWSEVAARAEITAFHDHVEEPDALVERLLPFDMLVLMRERTKFPRAILERLPHLRLIVSPGSRHIGVDLAAAAERGILVCGVPGAPNRSTTVELTWALILSLVRNIPAHDRSVRAGGWQLDLGTTLHGKTLGVIGLGLVGSGVARLGLAFGMEVIAWSPNLTAERCAEVGARLVGRDALLSTADVVSVHLALGERSRGLIGAAEIARMKPGAYLVNTARGPIVDQDALIDALTSRRIRGAAIDVYDIEPLPPDHPMRRLPNAITTPHLGFVTEENYRHFYGGCAEDVLAYLNGNPIRVLNAPQGG